MDLVSIGTMLGIAHLTKDAVSDILKRLFGPTADKAGNKLSAFFFERQAQRAMGTLADGSRMLDDAGLQAQPVPGRILWPILQYSSWEEDEALRRKWAALLANAASPNPKQNRILPAFPEILRQLTPVQAQLLQWMYDLRTIEPSLPNWPADFPDVSRETIEAKFSLAPPEYALLVSDLDRLQLIEGRRDLTSWRDKDMDEMLTLVVDRWNSRVKYESIGFVSLGVHFMEACTPPAEQAPGES